MKASANAKNLIKKYEGLRLTAYKAVESEKYYTIGYGHYSSDVKKGATITKEDAEKLLENDIEKSEKAVEKFNKKYNFSQVEFDALVSFAFNVGGINGLTQGGIRTKKEVGDSITLYVKSAGKTLQGLVKRREEEQKLYFSGKEEKKVKSIKKGDTGKLVKAWQCVIGATPDGIFGSVTLALTCRWQKEHGLKEDGVVGVKTWSSALN